MPKLPHDKALRTDTLGAQQTFTYEETQLFVWQAPDDVLNSHYAHGPDYTMAHRECPAACQGGCTWPQCMKPRGSVMSSTGPIQSTRERDVSDWT